MKQRKHIVISGTGRAGTTFLVELLTNLGLETGYEPSQMNHHQTTGRAGLENNLKSDDCPYIAKDPWFCDYADEILNRDDIVIEHIFIPVRNLAAAAESRRMVTREGVKKASVSDRIKFLLGKKKKFISQINTFLQAVLGLFFVQQSF